MGLIHTFQSQEFFVLSKEVGNRPLYLQLNMSGRVALPSI
jgi:hypothetical protein